MAKTYAVVFGIAYVLVALLEFFFKQVGGLLWFTPLHNGIHWLTGVLGLVAYGMGDASSMMYARVFGVVFLLVAILGFVAPDFLGQVLGYPVNLFYNVVHAGTGLIGLYIGITGMKKAA